MLHKRFLWRPLGIATVRDLSLIRSSPSRTIPKAINLQSKGSRLSQTTSSKVELTSTQTTTKCATRYSNANSSKSCVALSARSASRRLLPSSYLPDSTSLKTSRMPTPLGTTHSKIGSTNSWTQTWCQPIVTLLSSLSSLVLSEELSTHPIPQDGYRTE